MYVPSSPANNFRILLVKTGAGIFTLPTNRWEVQGHHMILLNSTIQAILFDPGVESFENTSLRFPSRHSLSSSFSFSTRWSDRKSDATRPPHSDVTPRYLSQKDISLKSPPPPLVIRVALSFHTRMESVIFITKLQGKRWKKKKALSPIH